MIPRNEHGERAHSHNNYKNTNELNNCQTIQRNGNKLKLTYNKTSKTYKNSYQDVVK